MEGGTMPLPEPAPIDVPGCLHALAQTLLSEGFVQRRQEYDGDSFGMWRLVLGYERLRVLVMLERSGWLVGAGWMESGTRKERWHSVETWKECLEQLDLLVSMTLERQAEYVAASWRDMEQALESERLTATDACLVERQIVRNRIVVSRS
jgi:hypothetical protein